MSTFNKPTQLAVNSDNHRNSELKKYEYYVYMYVFRNG